MNIKDTQLKQKLLTTLLFGATVLSTHTAQAARPLWTITASTPTTVTIPAGASTTVNYTVTNTSYKTRTLMWRPIAGVTQGGTCASSQPLPPNASCTLELIISSAAGAINGGPQVCQQGADGQPSPLQCYQPIASQSLKVSTAPMVAIGDSFGGGKVACLGSGPNQLLIAATMDNSATSAWDSTSIPSEIGPSAQSATDGASNTQAIVNALGVNGAAAKLCADYAVNAQGNLCQSGETCYSDWFLPADDQLHCLYNNRIDIGGFAGANYWGSTEFNASLARDQGFNVGNQNNIIKSTELLVRCVRGLTP